MRSSVARRSSDLGSQAMPDGVRGRTIRSEDLVSARLVELEKIEEFRQVASRFAVAVTEDMAALIDPADPADPIAAQFVPTPAELADTPEEQVDPIGDDRWSPI